MKYEAPQIVALASTIAVIQCTGRKNESTHDSCDSTSSHPTSAAYEADE
jgi:hypothetical protein